MRGVFFLLLLSLPLSVHAEDLGELSANPFNPASTSNPFGAGSPFKSDGINNPFSPYGSPFSNQSATNPVATAAPRLYDQQGNYRGKLSANPYDPDSTSNPLWTLRLSVFAGLDQESIRRRESLQPQQSHQSLRPRPAN